MLRLCPICKQSTGNFLNNLCPYCKSTELERTAYFLHSSLQLKNKTAIIIEDEFIKVYKMIYNIKKTTNLYDITYSLIKPESIDVDIIVGDFTLERVQNFIDLISFLEKIIFENKIFISMFRSDFLKEKTFDFSNTHVFSRSSNYEMFGDYQTFRRFGNDFKSIIDKHGLKCEIFDIYNKLPSSIYFRYGLNRRISFVILSRSEEYPQFKPNLLIEKVETQCQANSKTLKTSYFTRFISTTAYVLISFLIKSFKSTTDINIETDSWSYLFYSSSLVIIFVFISLPLILLNFVFTLVIWFPLIALGLAVVINNMIVVSYSSKLRFIFAYFMFIIYLIISLLISAYCWAVI